LIDRYGRRRVLLGGAAGFLVVTGLYHFAVTVPLVIGVRLIQGVAFAAFSTAAFALVADLVPAARRGEGIGVYTMATNVAQATAPAAALALLGASSFRAVFGAINAAAALAFALMLFVRVPAVKTPRLATARSPFRLSALVSREALFPAAILLAGSANFAVLMTFITLYGVALQVPNFNLFFTVLAVAMVVARVGSGYISDRYGRQVVILPGLLLAVLGPALLALGLGGVSFFLAGALFGLGFGTAQPALMALAVDRAPPERRGTATSTVLLAMDLGAGLGAIAFGHLAGATGFPTLYGVAAAILLAATLLYALGLARGL
jgi:MFS family permease